MEWLLWIIVIVAAILWFGREAPTRGPSPTSRNNRTSPPQRTAAPPPPVARDLRREREEEAFVEGAAFGWFAYREWFGDDGGDFDGEFTGEAPDDEEFEDEMDDDGWQELDDGLGF